MCGNYTGVVHSRPHGRSGHRYLGTLIVAIIALVISVSSLTWQIVLYLLGGARVRTELRVGALGPSGVVHGPVAEGVDFTQLAQQGYPEPVFAVQARNSGRLAVSVTKWDVALENGASFFQPGWPPNADRPLPYRLEPGDEAVWFCPMAPVIAAAEAFASSSHPVRLVRARIGLGTGKSVTSKNAMRVQESAASTGERQESAAGRTEL